MKLVKGFLLALTLFLNSCGTEMDSDQDSKVSVSGGFCGHKTGDWSRNNAACLIKGDHTVLMVYVPYGRKGWDFPGGQRKGGEISCQTAEREACEETGYRVEAIRKISNHVFECRIVGGGCSTPVDEGFLSKKWVSGSDLNHLRLRRGTWGDKRKLIWRHL